MTLLEKKAKQLEVLNYAYESIINKKRWYMHTDDNGNEVPDNEDTALENIAVIDDLAKKFLDWAMKI